MTYQTPPQPRQLRLDTTTECSARCLSCHRFLTQRKGTMPWGLVEEIVADVKRWKTPLTELVPVNYGEFFLYPAWQRAMEHVARHLPQTNIVLPTNGSEIDREKVKALAAIPNLRLVNFSVNAFFPETYEAFTGLPRRVPLQIETAIRDLRSVRPDITVWVSIVADPAYQTQNELEVFRAFWSNLATVQVLPAVSCGRPDKKVRIPNTQPCRSIFSDLAIGFERKLTACCFNPGFDIDLGSYTGDVRADWRNAQLKALRKAHNDGHRQSYPLCKGCSHA